MIYILLLAIYLIVFCFGVFYIIYLEANEDLLKLDEFLGWPNGYNYSVQPHSMQKYQDNIRNAAITYVLLWPVVVLLVICVYSMVAIVNVIAKIHKDLLICLKRNKYTESTSHTYRSNAFIERNK